MRESSHFNHDAHLWTESYLIRDDTEDELFFIFACSFSTCTWDGSSFFHSCFACGPRLWNSIYSCLLLTILLVLASPHYFHGLSATVLKEELSGNMFVGVLSSEVNIPGEIGLWLVINSLLAVESSSNTFGLELNLYVNAVIDDDVKGILELLNFISRAYDSDLLFFFSLDDAVALNYFPDRVLVLGKGGVLSVNLTDVCDRELLSLIF